MVCGFPKAFFWGFFWLEGGFLHTTLSVFFGMDGVISLSVFPNGLTFLRSYLKSTPVP